MGQGRSRWISGFSSLKTLNTCEPAVKFPESKKIGLKVGCLLTIADFGLKPRPDSSQGVKRDQQGSSGVKRDEKRFK